MIVIKPMKESFSPKLSCFWIVMFNNKLTLLGTETKIKDAEQSGDYLIDSNLHYLIWDSIVNSYPELKNKDWEYYPRGRVRFNTRINQCEIFADKKIINSNKCKELIRQELGLPPTAIFKMDEHYESVANL